MAIFQSIDAMRSLTILMARRATGVSAKRRRLAAVGRGVVFRPARFGPYGERIDGSRIVLRLPAFSVAAESAPARRCQASVTRVRRLTLFHSFRVQKKKAQRKAVPGKTKSNHG